MDCTMASGERGQRASAPSTRAGADRRTTVVRERRTGGPVAGLDCHRGATARLRDGGGATRRRAANVGDDSEYLLPGTRRRPRPGGRECTGGVFSCQHV